MVYFLLSIIVLTGLFWSLEPLRKRICPICAATVLTWLCGLGLFLIKRIDQNQLLFVIVLMAISLGAVIEKFGSRLGLLWKTAMAVLGAPALYFLFQHQNGKSTVLAVGLVLVTSLAWIFRKPTTPKEDAFQNCC